MIDIALVGYEPVIVQTSKKIMIIDFLINTFGCPHGFLPVLLVVIGSMCGPFLPILLIVGIENLRRKKKQRKEWPNIVSSIVFGAFAIIWVIYSCYCFMSLQAWLGACGEIG